MFPDRSLEEEISRLLVHLREARGVSQEALAAQLGRSQSYVAKLESGKLRVTLAMFLRWVAALGFREDEAGDLVRNLYSFAFSGSLWVGGGSESG